MRKNTMRNISNEDKIKNFYFLSPGLPLPISVITREPHKLSSKHVIVFRPEELPDDGGLAHAGAAQEHHGVFSHLITRPRICIYSLNTDVVSCTLHLLMNREDSRLSSISVLMSPLLMTFVRVATNLLVISISSKDPGRLDFLLEVTI